MQVVTQSVPRGAHEHGATRNTSMARTTHGHGHTHIVLEIGELSRRVLGLSQVPQVSDRRRLQDRSHCVPLLLVEQGRQRFEGLARRLELSDQGFLVHSSRSRHERQLWKHGQADEWLQHHRAPAAAPRALLQPACM